MGMSMQLCFKENERWIFDEVQRHSCKSAFIKDALAEHIKRKPDLEQPAKRKAPTVPTFKGV